MDLFWALFVGVLIFLMCYLCKTKRKPMFAAPVVVTATSIPVPPAGYPQAGYPQNTAVPGLHMSQPHPVYITQTAYTHSPNATAPYPDSQHPIDMNPPPYDQVVRGTDAYQKPLPYNPNFAGQQ